MNVREIAQAANVSPATVSLVLNGRPGVKTDTRQRVAQLLLENGYEIRQTRSSRETVRLMFLRYCGAKHEQFDPRYDFFVEIMNGIEYQAAEYGFQLSIANADVSSLDSTIRHAAKTFSGILLFGSELEQESVPVLLQSHCPLITIDAHFPSCPIHCVNIDNEGGIFQAVQHLHKLGHTKIGYLTSTAGNGAIPTRFQSFQSALQQYGLSYFPEYTFKLPPHLKLAENQMQKILDTRPPLPTAFAAANDSLTLGAMQALQQSGWRIPEDISLIGFDDAYLTSMSNPPLTSVSVPKEMIGRTAVRQMKHLLDCPGDSTIYKIQLCTKLIVRHSSDTPSC
ncbi:MAG: LacI family transcriptional regulator [Lachnospiraceae bacterium]|nr:LacI family transcriptional regulator [Lachnospiraceae bacterium]